MTRPLVVAAHGTASAAGREAVEACALSAARQLGVHHIVGYVDVCSPPLVDVLTPGAVVVPLFLASGYHVRHDVPAAAATQPDVIVTPALGADPAVVEALADRVLEAVGPSALDGVALASAGSSQAAARAEVDEVAALLAERLAVPVSVAYLSGPGPHLAEVCAAHRAAGRDRIAVASHLLGPGVFLDRARSLGREAVAIAVGAELATHPAISGLVAARYRAATESSNLC